MARFRQPPLVGYLVAGVLLGPTGFQLVESEGMIAGFAELGVLLLLFIVGMELSVRTLRYTWRIALPAIALQTAGCLGAIFAVARFLKISPSTAILLGYVITLSSGGRHQDARGNRRTAVPGRPYHHCRPDRTGPRLPTHAACGEKPWAERLQL